MSRAHRANFAVSGFALLLLYGCGDRQHAPRAPLPVAGYADIRERAVPLATDLPGRTSPFAVSEVRPQASGIIQRRLFTEGAMVKSGQPLYQIAPAPYRAAYDNARAVLVGAQGRAARYALLSQTRAIAAQANDDAQSAYLQAKANLDAARINLEFTRITAPITGHIGASSVTEGALVTAQQATALGVITTLDPIYVDIDQSNAELLALKRAIRAGQIDDRTPLVAAVKLTLDDGSASPSKGVVRDLEVTGLRLVILRS
jgi:membrane fusion protein, multidrug efflux system